MPESSAHRTETARDIAAAPARQLFDCLTDCRVVITGATGSFGRHITHELVSQGNLRHLTLFSRDEEKQRLLGIKLAAGNTPNFPINSILGDVRDRRSVHNALQGADVVINAAALKQVPSCELNALEAVQTNILGMQNILDAAHDLSVAQVLTISTDKAVQPINTMGISKAMQERLVQSYALRHEASRVTVVRYGNVLGTTGSILPVLIAQARRQRRIKVTDPAMTRFLLTLDDALGLVDTALAGSEVTGTTYVRYASAVTVQDFADVVVRLFGCDGKIEVDVVGPRPGDKFHEILVSEDEMRRSVRVGDHFVIPPVDPTNQPGADGAMQHFASSTAPRVPIEEFERMVVEWCASHGIDV